jgi:hypothetical protein
VRCAREARVPKQMPREKRTREAKTAPLPSRSSFRREEMNVMEIFGPIFSARARKYCFCGENKFHALGENKFSKLEIGRRYSSPL